MKKTLMLFALFFIIGTATKAQTMFEVKIALAGLAPHMPQTHRWAAGDGKKWHDGLNAQFTHETQDTVKMWIHDYSEEAHEYKEYFEEHFDPYATPTLSDIDAEIYWEIHAVWLMIHANHEHEQ